jgi:predicted amidohydrolase YtcJ
MCRKLLTIMKAEILFRNGTVFDGHRFLPAGTCVRVRGGRITGVGPAESLGSLGSAEPVDLDGGTLPAGAGGTGQDPFLPGQAIDLATALAAYTSGSARTNGLESVTGSIKAGLDADFAILDAGLAAIEPSEICQASVRQTWLRGHPA